MIKQLSTNSCETMYDVDGIVVRLFVIVGGTPAIEFADYSFTERYPDLPKYAPENWIDTKPCHYKHQDPQNIQGITYNELPDGEQTLLNFIKVNLPLKQLAEQRFNALPIKNIISKRTHDKEDATYVRAKLELRRMGVSPVTFESGCYWGRCSEKIALFNEWWKTTQKLFNSIFDSGKYGWHELSQTQYDLVKMQLEIYNRLYLTTK